MGLYAKWVRVRWRSRWVPEWTVTWVRCRRWRDDDASLWATEWQVIEER